MQDNVISNAVGQTLIVAYQEDTRLLESCLNQQGCACQVIRQVHQPDYQNFSPSYLCLLNHYDAWRLASQQSQPTLIVEADFVPVKNFGALPLPCDFSQPTVALAWLYTCAPQIYSVTESGHAVGFSTSMVAYVVSPLGAQRLMTLFEQITVDPGPTQYSAWDSSIEGFLRRQQLDCYVPWRNYGEHGGKPNYEHRQAGLSPAHRADVLYGQLAFAPLFVQSHRSPALAVFFLRLKARLKGMARLALGKYVRWEVLRGSSTPRRMLRFAVGRQLTLRL